MGCMFLETYPFLDYSICWCNWYISISKIMLLIMDPFPHFSSTDFPYFYPIWSVSVSVGFRYQTFLIVFLQFEILFSDWPCMVVVSVLFPSVLLKLLQLPAASPQLAVRYVLYLVSLRFSPARTMQIQPSCWIRKFGSVLAGGWAETASSECFHRQRSA